MPQSPAADRARPAALRAPRRRGAAAAFAAGRIAGIAAAVALFTVAADAVPESRTVTTAEAVLKILLGTGLVVLAASKLPLRPGARPAKGGELPQWMGSLDTMPPGQAPLLGFAVSVANPKELAFALSAGLAVGEAALPFGAASLTVLAFAVAASGSVLLPLLLNSVAPRAFGPVPAARFPPPPTAAPPGTARSAPPPPEPPPDPRRS
ncbi:GAP family protein [Zafaria sp. J156]|uniref:GAP family protein n=1 Tax=Zafaria sp. J156 TaxID=3116490 RepID=UPI002E76E364|nr:GAP family protein [Zafaria sp. J156]MEE1621021.1 GAP family protein [Zafaria sp. J156]